jgi:hypothetical protein
MNYKTIESHISPFSDYFKDSNPKYHERINKHYIKTIELVFERDKSVLLTEFRKNKDKPADNVIIYFCGYDDYFYHFFLFDYEKKDFDIIVVDIPGFGYNKRYSKNKPYQVERLYNFYSRLSDITKPLDVAFDYCFTKYSYNSTYLYSHSTGCNIVINYLQNQKQDMKFTKILLCSPLTRFYDPSPLKMMLVMILCMIFGFFTNYLDINALINGIDKKTDKTNYNKALNEIYGTVDLEYVNHNYTSVVEQPKFNGWINFVQNSLNGVKLNYNVSLICSQQYGKSGYFVSDAFLNPQYMVEDIRKIFKDPKIRQYRCGHDCLVSPSIDFKMMLDFLFE